MSHPLMFDDADPLLAKLRSITFSFPGAAEKITHGHPAFFTKKVFAYFGGSVRTNGEWFQHERSVIFMVDAEDRLALSQDMRFFVPAYLGPSGWIGLDLTKKTDWAEVAELVEASYRQTAPTKLVAQLDSGT
jgi:predicted DNA-binding protein (MmcQ/YjbR family)